MLSSAGTREGYHSRSRIPPAAGIMAVVPRAIRPLQGLRIVSLAQNLPGPLAVSRLVAAGAAALKIEPPAGDGFRQLAPRWYRHLHRGVRVQTLDLKSDVGRLSLSAVLATADLLLTSHRPASLARLGIDRRRLARQHPHLRWLNIVGDTGAPDHPGHDLTYQASAGTIGEGMPRTFVADLLGAGDAVAAALLLLRQPAPAAATVGLRDALEAARWPVVEALTAPGAVLGGGLPTYRLYDTRRGRVAIAALEPHFRARLYGALQLSDGDDLTEAMQQRTATQWVRWATARDIPLVAVDDTLHHPAASLSRTRRANAAHAATPHATTARGTATRPAGPGRPASRTAPKGTTAATAVDPDPTASHAATPRTTRQRADHRPTRTTAHD
jgi:crotonobetainyl-CoA:carnitine CoA-transferase CaiB-like acyl-CoA transferase